MKEFPLFLNNFVGSTLRSNRIAHCRLLLKTRHQLKTTMKYLLAWKHFIFSNLWSILLNVPYQLILESVLTLRQAFFYSVYFLRLEPFDFSVDCTELNLIFKKGIILKNALGERWILSSVHHQHGFPWSDLLCIWAMCNFINALSNQPLKKLPIKYLTFGKRPFPGIPVLPFSKTLFKNSL